MQVSFDTLQNVLPLDLIVYILSLDSDLIKLSIRFNKAIRARMTNIFLARFNPSYINQNELKRYLIDCPMKMVAFSFDQLPTFYDLRHLRILSSIEPTVKSGLKRSIVNEQETLTKRAKRDKLRMPMPYYETHIGTLFQYDILMASLYSVENSAFRYKQWLGFAHLCTGPGGLASMFVFEPYNSTGFTPNSLRKEAQIANFFDLLTSYKIYQQRHVCQQLFREQHPEQPSLAQQMVSKQFEDIVAGGYRAWTPIAWLAELQLYLYLLYNALALDIKTDAKSIAIGVTLQFDAQNKLLLDQSVLEPPTELSTMQQVRDQCQRLISLIRPKLAQLA